MSMSLNERNPNTDTIGFGNLGAGLTVLIPAKYFRKHSRIKNVWLVNMADVASDATNHVVLTLQDNAGSPNAYASLDTHGAALANGVPKAFTLSSPDEDSATQEEQDVPAGTSLNLSVVSHGSAVITLGAVMIEWYPL